MLVIDSETGLAEQRNIFHPRNNEGFTNGNKVAEVPTCRRADDSAFQQDVGIYISMGFRTAASSDTKQNWAALRDHISACDYCRARAKTQTMSA